MTRRRNPQAARARHNRLTLGSDAAFAVAMLAAKEAEWITGQVFSVSGGFCMAG